MKLLSNICPAFLFAAALMSGCVSDNSSLKMSESKWLFFSEDSASPIENTWTLQNNELACSGTPRGYLYTAEEYSNFKLSMEFQRPADPTSSQKNRGGILIRKTGDNKIWPKCLEAQLNAPNAGDFVSIGGFKFMSKGPLINTIEHPSLGKILVLPKALDSEKPAGRWNRYEVTAINGTVTIRLNGTLVNTAIKCETTHGAICITSEGDPIRFRNIQITELPQ